MSETKFTPGPWNVISMQGEEVLKYAITDRSGCVAWAVNRATVNTEANAHLIAATPNMFKTLDDVLSVLLDLDQDHLNRREEKMVCDAIQEIEAVLSKARGEHQQNPT